MPYIENDDARAARNAYLREWRKRNKDKVKAAQERHWQKVAEKQAEQKEAVNGEQREFDTHE